MPSLQFSNAEMYDCQGVCDYHSVELSINDACVENVGLSSCWKYCRLKTSNGTTSVCIVPGYC